MDTEQKAVATHVLSAPQTLPATKQRAGGREKRAQMPRNVKIRKEGTKIPLFFLWSEK